MERIAQLVETEAVRPPAIKVYPLSQAVEAHGLSESRHFRGKLVFQLR
jgi:NADPH:quinone reductase-like Zn-dependent oxidoreductase